MVAFRAESDPLTQSVRAAAGRQRVWVFLPNDQPNEFIGRFLQFQLSPTPATIERSAAAGRSPSPFFWGRRSIERENEDRASRQGVASSQPSNDHSSTSCHARAR